MANSFAEYIEDILQKYQAFRSAQRKVDSLDEKNRALTEIAANIWREANQLLKKPLPQSKRDDLNEMESASEFDSNESYFSDLDDSSESDVDANKNNEKADLKLSISGKSKSDDIIKS